MAWLHYFAYGSNMHPARLRERTPSCQRLDTTILRGYALRFHQRSATDGSAKCNVVATGDPQDVVYGVLYAIAEEERVHLDAAEDLGRGYEIHQLEVECVGQAQAVFGYVAVDGTIDETVLPYRWYRDIVLHGARQHGFPADYVAWIACHPVIEDADRQRAARHARLLELSEPLDNRVSSS